MACCANTSRKAPTCPVTPSATWTRSPSPSTVGPGRPSSGGPQPRRSTSYSRLHRLVLHRSLEPKLAAVVGVVDELVELVSVAAALPDRLLEGVQGEVGA